VLTRDLTASTRQEISLALPVQFTYAWLLWLKGPTRHNEIRLRFEVLAAVAMNISHVPECEDV
jgi:hypothetical protein